MSKRILMISNNLEQRGSSHYTLNLARELVANGLEVRVFASGGGLIDQFRAARIRVDVFTHLERPLFAPIQMKRLEGALANFDPDIIHLQNRNVLGVGAWLCKFPYRMVITVHSKAKDRRHHLSRLKRINGVIATNEPVREDLVNVEHVPKELIAMIPSGVDIQHCETRPTRPLFSEPVRLIGTIGPVEAQRGQDHFIKAIPFVMKRYPDAHFLVVGEGPHLTSLRRLAATLALQPHVTFVSDFARYEDIIETLDIVVYTSLEDVSAFSLLEAMAWGRPVVAFGTPAVGAIIEHRRTGLLVNRGDVQGLVSSILELLTNPPEAVELAEAGQGVIREYFDKAVVARKVMQFYRKVHQT